MSRRWCIQGGRILAGTSGVALCAALSLPLKAVGTSLPKMYAIEVIHVRRDKRYVIRRVCGTYAVPAEAVGKSYATETEARRAARDMGVSIEAVGDLYQICRRGT